MLPDMSDTDLELLARYSRQHAEDAFAEVVRRHLGLVYSAALRQVRSPQLAEEVAQSTFIDLARSAAKLKPDTILTAWLYQVTRRTAIDVVRREASRQLREQIATEMNAMNATAADWTHIEPLLDEAMHALDETDRTAVLLRYFENKSLREVGATLGTTDDAARKRVNRAVECLREYLARRGVTTGASGLVVVISANAIQAAPAGLSAAIASAVAGTATFVTATATVTKAIIMTTTQKALVAAALAAAIGTGIYQAHQASTLRTQIHTLQQQTALTEQLTRDRDDAVRQLATLRADNERLTRDTVDLLRLRAEVTRLRQVNQMPRPGATQQAAAPAAPPAPASVNPGEYVLRDKVVFAGFATPEATMQSMSWAMSTANYEGITNALSPKAYEEDQRKPNSRATIEASFTHISPRFLAMQILARKDISDQEVEMKVKWDIGVQPVSATGPEASQPGAFTSQVMVQRIVKVGNEWKREGSISPYKPDWDKNGNIQNFVP
jgi:RNA polymerase sigma factor (sigma-70 family)